MKRCWCGKELEPIGKGNYPYPCRAQELRPNDMIYACPIHKGWNTAHDMKETDHVSMYRV